MASGYGAGAGLPGLTSVEVFVPGRPESSCRVPDLPASRPTLTLDLVDDQIVVCGGAFDVNDESVAGLTWDNCLGTAGDRWTKYAELEAPRCSSEKKRRRKSNKYKIVFFI